MDATNAEQKMKNLVDGVWLRMMKVELQVVKKEVEEVEVSHQERMDSWVELCRGSDTSTSDSKVSFLM